MTPRQPIAHTASPNSGEAGWIRCGARSPNPGTGPTIPNNGATVTAYRRLGKFTAGLSALFCANRNDLYTVGRKRDYRKVERLGPVWSVVVKIPPNVHYA
jgi:hypothetical protein